MKRIAALGTALLTCSLAYAKPTSEEVQHVIDYYYNGQAQGVVLADVKICDDIYTKGDQKNECMAQREHDTLIEGESTHVWMMFMVPNGLESQKVMLQLNHRGMTMAVRQTKISSGIRYRTWEKIKPDRSGKWSVKIFHDKGEDLELIKELTLNVVAPVAQTQ